MDLYEAMRTTFAAREFTADPLPDDVLYRILDNARFAPSGGNRQGWRVIIVRDPATRLALAGLAEPGAKRYAAQLRAGQTPWNPVEPPAIDAATIAATPPPRALTQPFLDAAAVLVVCVDLRLVAATDQHLGRTGIVGGASVYPFAWNILLAARAEGFGGTITTIAISEEPRVKDVLGIPGPIAVAALIPLGRPARRLRRLRRDPVTAFTMLERWDGPKLQPPSAGGG
jgi:nitroreductase